MKNFILLLALLSLQSVVNAQDNEFVTKLKERNLGNFRNSSLNVELNGMISPIDEGEHPIYLGAQLRIVSHLYLGLSYNIGNKIRNPEGVDIETLQNKPEFISFLDAYQFKLDYYFKNGLKLGFFIQKNYASEIKSVLNTASYPITDDQGDFVLDAAGNTLYAISTKKIPKSFYSEYFAVGWNVGYSFPIYQKLYVEIESRYCGYSLDFSEQHSEILKPEEPKNPMNVYKTIQQRLTGTKVQLLFGLRYFI
ncbi:MAG: hypothetical protein N4A45_02915 [Flavobacteriales bacterium]|jgi:hypothetical protein|nr:hypothetical protein [Flavobacteriales bacterium]